MRRQSDDIWGNWYGGTVEETLNGMLDAGRFGCPTPRSTRGAVAGIDTRAGHYQRRLHTRAGEMTLKVPKLRQQTFCSTLIRSSSLPFAGGDCIYICTQMQSSRWNIEGYWIMDVNKLKGRTFKGFMADDEAARLYELAREAARQGPCLEIGSYCGRSSAYLGLGCQEAGGILFSIDHHQGSEEQQPGGEYYDPELLDPATGRIDTFPFFRKTLQELSLDDTVVPIVSRSDVAARFWRTPLSLIFIDGGHSFETVYTDYNCWISFLLSGGYLIVHDVF